MAKSSVFKARLKVVTVYHSLSTVIVLSVPLVTLAAAQWWGRAQGGGGGGWGLGWGWTVGHGGLGHSDYSPP